METSSDGWHITDEGYDIEDWCELPMDIAGGSSYENEGSELQVQCSQDKHWVDTNSREENWYLQSDSKISVQELNTVKKGKSPSFMYQLDGEVEHRDKICSKTKSPLAVANGSERVNQEVNIRLSSYELENNVLKMEGSDRKPEDVSPGTPFEDIGNAFLIYDLDSECEYKGKFITRNGRRDSCTNSIELPKIAGGEQFVERSPKRDSQSSAKLTSDAGCLDRKNEIGVDIRYFESVNSVVEKNVGAVSRPQEKDDNLNSPHASSFLRKVSSKTSKKTVQGTLLGFLGLKRKSTEQNAGSEANKVQRSISSYFSKDSAVLEENSLLLQQNGACAHANTNVSNTFSGLIDIGAPKSKRWKSESREGKDVVQQRNTSNNWKQTKSPCPFYKKMPGTSFAVDAFKYGAVPGISAYFLTHFHSDHYGGLSKAWAHGPIFCTPITASLAKMCLGVDSRWLRPFKVGTTQWVDKVEVTFIPANHCPGAALILFRLPVGTTILHTGDFRASRAMQSYPHLYNCRIDSLYLDTTYCHPKYCFPLQDDVIQFVIAKALNQMKRNRRTLVVVGSYSIGKERVFLSLAEAMKVSIYVDRRRQRVLEALNWPELSQRLTTDGTSTPLHVLPLGCLNPQRLMAHMKSFGSMHDTVLAFRPTGWTYNEKVGTHLELIKPRNSGNISVYGVPYSEHSSFTELREFVQFLRPGVIVPTVNVGNRAERERMQSCFKDWLHF